MTTVHYSNPIYYQYSGMATETLMKKLYKTHSGIVLDTTWKTTIICLSYMVNILRGTHNGQHFADDIFKRIFFNENVWISNKISLRFIHNGPIYNIAALVQIMAWRCPGDKPLSEPMLVSLPTHICVIRPQCVNSLAAMKCSFNLELVINILSISCKSAPRGILYHRTSFTKSQHFFG